MPVTPDQFSNNGYSSVAGGAGGRGTALGASDTTLYLPVGDGAKMPGAVPFMVLLTQNGSSSTNELARCSAIAGDVLTLVRGQEGTTARQWVLGSTVEQVVSAGNLSNLWTQIAALAPTGGVPYYNVKTYGAVGNGSNDDTSAIQSAINAASAAGGGCVYFPAGTYITRTLTLANYVHLRGDGISATTLKLKSGTNGDLLWGGASNAALINLAAAAQSGQIAGGAVVGNFGLYDLTLDGNRSGQVSGPSYCLRIYGFGFIIDNVRMRQGFSGGALVDWNGAGSGPSTYDSMESQWTNVKIHECGGIGLEMGGPHDSVFDNVIIYYTDSHALHVAPNANSLVFSEVHCWTTNPNNTGGVTSVGMLIESQSNHFAACQSESCQAVEVVFLAGGQQWLGGRVFGGNSRLAVYGFQLGQSNGATAYSGQILSTSAPAAVKDILIETSFSECQSGAINFVNESNNELLLHIQQSSGTVLGGTPAASDRLLLDPRGVTATGTAATSGLNRYTSGSSEAAAIYTPGGTQIENVDASVSPAIRHAVNGTRSRWYSDSYTTLKAAINDDGNGSVWSAGYLQTGPSTTPTSGSPQIGSGANDSSPWVLNVASVGMFRTLPQANCTAVALQAGVRVGQIVTVTNESSAFTITFATAPNSRVADGTSDVIAANTARQFQWNGTNWMRMG